MRPETPTPRSVVAYSSLSEETQREVRIAIEKGRYDAPELALLDEPKFDIPRTRVVYQGEVYQPNVAVGTGSNGSSYVLTFEKVDGERTAT